MSTTQTDVRTATDIEPENCVNLHDVTWAGYKALLRIRGVNAVPRIIYLDGEVWLMSPSYGHERPEARLAQLVRIVAEELDIPFTSAGHTTFRRKLKNAGIEGDATFYFANELAVRGKADLDLRFDPPPDLAIEAVRSNPGEPAEATWRRLRVPEIWICDAKSVRILVRSAQGPYRHTDHSLCLPPLTCQDILEQVHQPEATSELDWIKAVRRWAREVLVPRARGTLS